MLNLLLKSPHFYLLSVGGFSSSFQKLSAPRTCPIETDLKSMLSKCHIVGSINSSHGCLCNSLEMTTCIWSLLGWESQWLFLQFCHFRNIWKKRTVLIRRKGAIAHLCLSFLPTVPPTHCLMSLLLSFSLFNAVLCKMNNLVEMVFGLILKQGFYIPLFFFFLWLIFVPFG